MAAMHVTYFNNQYARKAIEENVSLEDLKDLVLRTRAKTKNALPWLKAARFGDKRTAKGSLRNDANVQTISGIELDYDGKQMSIEDAVKIAKKNKLQCLIYTSPSHTKSEPKWRIILPTSEELPPGERDGLVEYVDKLYGDIFSPESYTLSQSYFYGQVGDNPDHRAVIVDGEYVDKLANKKNPFEQAAEVLQFNLPIDIDARLAAMRHGDDTGNGIHQTQLVVSASMLSKGFTVDETVEKILAATKKAAPSDWD
jgi:hypothetical protein